MNQVIAIDDKEGRLAMRASIEQFEAAMVEHVGSDHGERDELNANGLEEYLVGGAYTRILTIPAGVTIVSELWNRERLWIILSGTVHVRMETGDEKIVGPHIRVAPFGTKVVLYAETEVVWAAITGVTETNDATEAEKIVKATDYADLTYPWDLLESQQ